MKAKDYKSYYYLKFPGIKEVYIRVLEIDCKKEELVYFHHFRYSVSDTMKLRDRLESEIRRVHNDMGRTQPFYITKLN